MPISSDLDYLAPRRCLREPIAAILHAAHLLDRATGAHLAGDHDASRVLLRQANMPEIRQWTESMWGSAVLNPDQPKYLRIREVPDAPPYLDKASRIVLRMPTSAEKRSIIGLWGHNCAFCGIPVVRDTIRRRFCEVYPDAVQWGSTNPTQHAAFQCLWLQYDHLLPHARGGGNGIENVVVTCAPCNYGRMNRTLDEVGLTDPRRRRVIRTSWDGLERMLASSTAGSEE